MKSMQALQQGSAAMNGCRLPATLASELHIQNIRPDLAAAAARSPNRKTSRD
jgi:hypothetical protein